MVQFTNTTNFENEDNIFMAARYTYHPVGSEAPAKAWLFRKKVWRFKDGDTAAASETAKWVAQTLDEHFALLDQLTLVCIPASTPEATQARYEQFAEEVCQATKMRNAYKHITVEGARLAIHEHKLVKYITPAQVIKFDRRFFNGRKVIIFDDVITKGTSFKVMADALEEMGAQVMGGIFLAKTAEQPQPEAQ